MNFEILDKLLDSHIAWRMIYQKSKTSVEINDFKEYHYQKIVIVAYNTENIITRTY